MDDAEPESTSVSNPVSSQSHHVDSSSLSSRPTDLISVKSVIQSIETSQTITDIPSTSIDSKMISEVESKPPQSETDVSLTEVSQLTSTMDTDQSAITVSAMTTKPTSASQAHLDENNHRTLNLVTTNYPDNLATTVATNSPVNVSVTNFDGAAVNRQPMAMMMNAADIEAMSNEAVLEALREMATQSMTTAAQKSAQEEVFASIQKSIEAHHEEGEVVEVMPELDIKAVDLKVEREIQVHNDQPALDAAEVPTKTIALEIKTADVVFEVEQVDAVPPPVTDLPLEFPGMEHMANATYTADGQFDMSRLGRTATIHSRKPLVDGEANMAAADDDHGDEEKTGTMKSKKGTLKSKKGTLKQETEPPKDIYKHPGCFVTLLRLFFSTVNLIVFILALIGIGFGLYGQIQFRLKSKVHLDFDTDPTFIILICSLVIIVAAFNGLLGLFRGNGIMLKLFCIILTLLFLCVFVGGIAFFIIYENQNFTESLEKSFRKWIRLGFRDGNLSIRDVIGRVQSLARCCGSSGKFDYTYGYKDTMNSYGNCTTAQVQQLTCQLPLSCCPGGLDSCLLDKAIDTGCVKKFVEGVGASVGPIVGIWFGAWLLIVLEMLAVKHVIRRLALSRKWHEGTFYGHIEAEEKLKAKLAKKEKNLTQIEMDVCVQDMG